MTSKILRANGSEIYGIKSVIYKEVVNTGEGLRPGCVASASIDVEVFGAQSSAPQADEALTYYHVDSDGNETLFGVFYAEPSIPTKNTYHFVAYDAVSKLDVSFSERLNAIQGSFPLTVYDLVAEACAVAGVTLGSTAWPLSTQEVQAFYADGLTCRNILQYAAELAGRFVRCDTSGNIVFGWYTTNSTYTIHPGATQSGEIAYKQNGLTYDNYTVLAVDAVAIRPSGTEGAAYIYPASYEAVTAKDPNGDGNVILTNLTVTDDGNGNLYLSVEATDDGNANVTISETVAASNTLILGDNLLLTNATAAVYNAAAQNIYEVMSALPGYRHSTIQLFPNENPFRAGEFVNVTDAQGVSFYTPVFEMTVQAAFSQLHSSGNETYATETTSMEKALKNLSNNIVQINRLKVGWADIEEAIIQYLKLYGLMTVYQDSTLALQGGRMGFATANSVIGNGIALIGKVYTAAPDPEDPPEESETESVVAAGEAGVFLGFHGAMDPHYDGGVDVYKPNYSNYIQIDANGVQLNGRFPLAEIGTLSSLKTTVKTSLVAAINELSVPKNYKLAGVVLDATSSTARFTAMRQLFNIAVNKIKDASYSPSTITYASKCAVCIYPSDAVMYENYGFELLYAQNADVQAIPASLTKLITLITALPYISTIKTKITLVSGDIEAGSGSLYYDGDIMTIEDMIYGMLLESSNTCARTLAHYVGTIILGNTSATVTDALDAFIAEMTAKAESIGCTNTVIYSPSGLSSATLSTAEDMLRVLIAASGWDIICRVWNKKSYDIDVEGPNARTVSITTTVQNASLESSYYIFGGKTGHITASETSVGANALAMIAEPI